MKYLEIPPMKLFETFKKNSLGQCECKYVGKKVRKSVQAEKLQNFPSQERKLS